MKKKIYIEAIILILLGFFSSLSLPPFNYLLVNFFTFSYFYILLTKIFETSKNKKLFFQAGAGIVSKSSKINELNEVNNKVRALKKSIEQAEKYEE